MKDKMQIPAKAFKRPVEAVPLDASERKFNYALKKSGLVYMMELMYPRETSQNN